MAGEDPTGMLAEAGRWLVKVGAKAGDQATHREALAAVPLLAAQWTASRGADPTVLLTEADRRIEDFGRRHPGSGLDLQAAAALERALWERRAGRSVDAVVKRGLGSVAGMIEAEPRNPEAWVAKARLESVAGQTAAARESLARAVQRNALVKGSRAYRNAEAELAQAP
jgi:hypothetical protein